MMHTGLCYNVKWQNGGGSLQSALMTNTSHEISMSIDTTKKKKNRPLPIISFCYCSMHFGYNL
jgi:hypothetical protein